MTNNDLRQPAYAEYPVVGVNWIQATEFAKWRTNRVNAVSYTHLDVYKRQACGYRSPPAEVCC